MNCKQCGAQMEEDTELCPDCKMGDEVTAAEMAEPEETETAEAIEIETEVMESDAETSEACADEVARLGTDGAEAGAAAVSVRKKGAVPFVISLVLIAGLALGLYFAFFASGGSDEDKIMKTFHRFETCINNGDVDGMRACFVEGEIHEDEIPMFGPSEEFIALIQEGTYGDLDIDYTNTDTVVKSFVEGIGLKFALAEEGIVFENEGELAVLNLIQTFSIDGEDMEIFGYFLLKNYDGKWLITFEA